MLKNIFDLLEGWRQDAQENFVGITPTDAKVEAPETYTLSVIIRKLDELLNVFAKAFFAG